MMRHTKNIYNLEILTLFHSDCIFFDNIVTLTFMKDSRLQYACYEVFMVGIFTANVVSEVQRFLSWINVEQSYESR